ncbi:peptidoglycan-binding protein [Pseudahrensia aquimaris]|uniref:Peptidoglycan-binding protein n=1 Tax=Pseudahrensia aquimaris TaxID=744461 RepID=A0ABW3FGI9_9HYPH
MSILKRGLKGVPVKRLQESLGIGADGDFGPGTERAVKEFQKANGLVVDGIAGPDTFTAMGLHELVLLRVGSRGEAVKKMQADLGIDADGRFGPGTKKAVMTFQEANGLVADGMAGPATLSKMASFADVVTPETVARAEVSEAEAADWEVGPLPQIEGGWEPVKGGMDEPAPTKSMWGRVKGWFG